MNFSISSSLSTINFTATDCTRPADKPLLTFFHSNGLILYPTILSKTRLACCASTKFKSMFLGSLIAFCTAPFVISLNVTLVILLFSSFIAEAQKNTLKIGLFRGFCL